jgi:ribosomal protein S18 acetylase RimI-like enzyme
MQQITIRRANEQDVDAAVDVWERARWDARQPHMMERMDYSHEANVAHFRDVVMRETDVWLAVERDRVLGLLAVVGDRVHQLHVRPDFQRRGIGTELLNHARALSPRGLSLHTFQGNRPSRAFYERSGFRVIRLGISPPPESEPDMEYRWRPDEEAPPSA